jgi:hypothetical protein
MRGLGWDLEWERKCVCVVTSLVGRAMWEMLKGEYVVYMYVCMEIGKV